MKKTIRLILLLISTLVFCSCAGRGALNRDGAGGDRVTEGGDIDLNAPGTVIAIMMDLDLDLHDYYPDAEILFVKSEAEGLLAVTSGQADAFVEKSSFIKTLEGSGFTGVHIHSDGQIGEIGKVAAAVSPATKIPDAEKKINAFIAEITEDGTLDEMRQRWLRDKDYTMPEFPETENPTCTIHVGTTGLATPYSFIQDGELAGLDVELALRFAAWLGADIEFSQYDWDGIIVACSTGKVDYAISNLFVTEEKAEAVFFSEPYSTFDNVLYVRDLETTGAESFLTRVKNSFRKTFITENRWKLLVKGLLVTVEISLGAALLGILLGSVLSAMHRSKRKLFRLFSDGFSYVISGIPALVILMIVYFLFFAKSSISPVISGIITFGFIFGITFSSILSTAIEAVDRGQWEAAKALGFRSGETFFLVILPQTVRIVLPIIKGEFVSMMKLTSIVGYIAIQDLTKAGDIIRARTFEAFFPLISVALMYFLLSTAVIIVLGKLEVRTDFTKRRNRIPRGVDPNTDIADASPIARSEGREEVIRVEHLKKIYEKVTPLTDFNASVKRGDVISVIGPSGTGKSTLLRLLNRLEEPSGGKIVVFGMDEDARSTDMNTIRRKMGMVFQTFNLFHHLNVIENIMLGPCRLLNLSRQEAYENGIRLLRMVGLGERALDMPSDLSGGQKQRVAIARALAMKPDIILFDEPTSALDPAMAGEVLDVIKDLTESGITMLIVTHEMSFAREVSTRIFYLDRGELYEEGTPEAVFDEPVRTRTRIFINKLKSAEITVASREFDRIEAARILRRFAEKNKLGEETAENLCELFRTVLSHHEFIPKKGEEHKLHVVIEYDTANGKLSMLFIREGIPCDASLSLGSDREKLLSLCESAKYTFENGKNIFALSI